jgi:hypothetical protein
MLSRLWFKMARTVDYYYYIFRLHLIHALLYVSEEVIKSKPLAEWSFRRLERFGE